MATRHHLKLDIRGALSNFRKRDWDGVMTNDDGSALTANEAKEYLLDCLSKGWKYLPYGECDGFNHETGCPGHEVHTHSYKFGEDRCECGYPA